MSKDDQISGDEVCCHSKDYGSRSVKSWSRAEELAGSYSTYFTWTGDCSAT